MLIYLLLVVRTNCYYLQLLNVLSTLSRKTHYKFPFLRTLFITKLTTGKVKITNSLIIGIVIELKTDYFSTRCNTVVMLLK